MKSKIYEFDPVVYPFPLLVTKDYDVDELKSLFYIVLNRVDCTEITHELDTEPTVSAKTTVVISKKTNKMYYLVLIINPGRVNIQTIAHEAYHATTYNSFWLGFGDPQPATDEPQAYFCGWAANCINSVINDQEKLNLYKDN